jgi:hypothetical protein
VQSDGYRSPATAGALNFSGTTEADRDLTGFDDDGNIAAAIGELQHSCETLLVFQHVDVLDGDFAAGVSLPGARRVRSEVFSKDNDFFVHVFAQRTIVLAKISARQLNCKGADPYVTLQGISFP